MSEAHALLLKEAFDKFHDAGLRLEQRYDELLSETEHLRATVKEKEEQIKKQERLALLGSMAAALAHEVRNPLGAMRLFVSLLRKKIVDSGIASVLDKLDGSITSLESVVSNILVFAKDRNPPKSPVHINNLLNERASHFSSVYPKMNFELSLDDCPWVYGCEESLRRALSNLILNAAEASHGEGVVAITTSAGTDGEKIISIQDSGPGFNTEMLSSVFEPFVSSKPSGTGLGLAIVKQTILQHGGSITAKNNSKGAEVTFSLKIKKTED